MPDRVRPRQAPTEGGTPHMSRHAARLTGRVALADPASPAGTPAASPLTPASGVPDPAAKPADSPALVLKPAAGPAPAAKPATVLGIAPLQVAEAPATPAPEDQKTPVTPPPAPAAATPPPAPAAPKLDITGFVDFYYE